MGPRLVIFVICLVLGPIQIGAQFEDLVECLGSNEFVTGFAECLVAGIGSDVDISSLPLPEDIIGAEDYGDTAGASRKLQAIRTNLDTAAQKYVVDLKLKEMGVNGNTMYNDFVAYANAWAAGGADVSLAERIKHIDLRKFVGDEYIHRFTDHFTEVVTKAVYLKEYAHTIRTVMERAGRPSDAIQDTLFSILENDLTPAQCLQQYSPADFEDGLDWIQCLVRCDNLGPIAQCSADMFAMAEGACSRVQWFSDVLVGIIIALVNKTSCDFTLLTPANVTDPVLLVEGGPSQDIEFKSYVPPGVMCLGADPLNDPIALGLVVAGNVFGFDVQCDVEMQLTSANWLDEAIPYIPLPDRRSKCRVPNRVSHQVAVGFHPATTNNSAVFKITDGNWNETFVIPLLPVVDHRVDGDTTVDFTMKLVVQGEARGDTVKFPVEVADTDPVPGQGPAARIGPVECYSLNDPHVMTFDGHYYNNFHYGAFYLYKHDTLPYEVQTIYQPCEVGNKNGSCNCAVAVRSGDDVFVMDRCRRTDPACPQGVCAPVQTVVLYTNDELTPGTRVFKMDGGLRHDVVLPHGTIIKIVTSNDLLNVWIMPGSYDRDMTKGLCGTYNVDSTDDLTLPDGTLYGGPGAGLGEQPKEFSQAWRVADADLLFEGAPMASEEFSPLKACHCTHILFSAPRCECGRESVTEICDLFMEGEYGDNITAIEIPSLHSEESQNFLDDIDLDVTYDPPLLADKGWQGVWNESAATQFCENLIRNTDNKIIQECYDKYQMNKISFPDAELFCIQDIQLLDNTTWMYSAIDNAKFRCYNQLVREINVRADVLNSFPNSSCVNECLGQGVCTAGTCECQAGYWGPDCRLTDTAQPSLTAKQTQICDSRSQVCNFATIMGQNFAESVDMRCQVKNVEITSSGVDYLPKRKTTIWEHDMTVISMNQAACPLPGNGSYEVSVAWRATENTAESGQQGIMGRLMRYKRDLDVKLMATDSSTVEVFIYITHDSTCYECDADGQNCIRKSSDDYCWIKNECWAPGQTKINDTCRFCSPADSTSQWTLYDTDACTEQKAAEDAVDEEERSDLILRASLGGCICAIVVIIVIVIFCVTHNKNKKTQMTESEVMRGNDDILPRPGTVSYSEGMYSGVEAYDNLALRDDGDLDKMQYDVMRHNSFGNASLSKQTRVDMLKNEELPRKNSLGNASTRSAVQSQSTMEHESFKTAL